MRLSFLFSGQGEVPTAETVQMWRTDPDAAAVWAQSTDILGEPLDRWLDEGQQADTRKAQLIASVGAVATYAVVERELGLVPHFIMGHSIGELPALKVACGLDLATMLDLVDARGTAMAAAIAAGPPMGMRAVLNPPDDLVERVAAYQDVHVANLNSASQMVVSGTSAALEEFATREKLAGVPLKVSGAFHTPFMAQAADEFRAAVHGTVGAVLSGPVVVANRTALPFDTANIVEELCRQIVSPVRWGASITYAYDHGSQLLLDLSSTGMFARMSERADARYIACGNARSIEAARHVLRHTISVQRGYDLAAHALGAIVTTRNEQPDEQLYRATVIPCYQELRQMVGRETQAPERILDLVEQALITKGVDVSTRQRKLDSLRWRAARLSVN